MKRLSTVQKIIIAFVVGAALFTAVPSVAQRVRIGDIGFLMGHLRFTPDNTYDIGASGATRPRSVYVGTDVELAGLVLWPGGTTITGAANGNILLRNNAGTGFTRQQFGGTTAAFPGVAPVTTTGGWGLKIPSAADTNGQAMGFYQITELTTIAAAATTDTAIQIPANAIVIGVSVRVTTVIPTAATFTVIGAGTSTAFQTGASVAVAADTTDAGTKACPYLNVTAQAIRITPNVQPAANTGRVRVTIHYMAVTPPTS